MYLPNIHFIPEPFNDCIYAQEKSAEPKISAAELDGCSSQKNENSTIELLMILLLLTS